MQSLGWGHPAGQHHLGRDWRAGHRVQGYLYLQRSDSTVNLLKLKHNNKNKSSNFSLNKHMVRMAAGEITVHQFFRDGRSHVLEMNEPAQPVSAGIAHTPVPVLIHSVG